jgi:integrase/recombinase XerD
MSIALQLDSYLSVRGSLGYDLRTDERVLRRFTRFADQEGAVHIDTALFLRWDASLPDVGTSTRSARFGKVRLFAQWLNGVDPAHEVPPRDCCPTFPGGSAPISTARPRSSRSSQRPRPCRRSTVCAG